MTKSPHKTKVNLANKIPIPRKPVGVSKEEIQSIERELKSKVPREYAEFLKKYGPGELCGWLRIHGHSREGKNKLDVLKLNHWLRENLDCYDAPQSVQDKLRDAIVFADTPAGDVIFWLGKRISQNDESVFLVERRALSVSKVADTFGSLILNFIEGKLKAFREITIDQPIQFTPILQKTARRPAANVNVVKSRLEALSKLKTAPKRNSRQKSSD